MDYTKVFVAGRLTKDVEYNAKTDGASYVRGGIAVNNSKEQVSFFNFVAFNKLADVMSKYFKKGMPVFLEGKLRQYTYVNKDTGVKTNSIEIIVDNFQFLGVKKDDSSE